MKKKAKSVKKKSVKAPKKPKKTITRIWDENYGREIWLAVGYTRDDLNTLAKKKFNLKGDMPKTQAEGSVHILEDDNGRKTYILRMSEFKFEVMYNALLIHELHHLTHEVLEDTGMPYHQKNCEAYAYFIQSLFTKMAPVLARYVGQK